MALTSIKLVYPRPGLTADDAWEGVEVRAGDDVSSFTARAAAAFPALLGVNASTWKEHLRLFPVKWTSEGDPDAQAQRVALDGAPLETDASLSGMSFSHVILRVSACAAFFLCV